MVSSPHSRSVAAAVLLLALAGAAPGEMPLPTAEAEKARRLIQDLGSADYRTREKASGQLVRMGPAVESILREGLTYADPEIRSRCRHILPLALTYDLERRLQAFLGGKEDKERPAPPGWPRFKTLAGDDPKTRDLFANMYRYDSEFLTALDRKPSTVKERLDARCIELVARLNQGGNPMIPPEQLSLLLFASLEPKLRMDEQSQSNLTSALISLGYRSRTKRLVQNNTALRRLLVKYVTDDRRLSDGSSLVIVSSFELKESLEIARGLLKKADQQPATRGMAIMIMGRFGDKPVIPEILPLLNDKEALGETNFGNNAVIKTQVRDVALAALLQVTGQSPGDYGFAYVKLFGGGLALSNLSPAYLGFSDNSARDAAHQKWDQWYAKNKDSITR